MRTMCALWGGVDVGQMETRHAQHMAHALHSPGLQLERPKGGDPPSAIAPGHTISPARQQHGAKIQRLRAVSQCWPQGAARAPKGCPMARGQTPTIMLLHARLRPRLRSLASREVRGRVHQMCCADFVVETPWHTSMLC